VAALLAATVTAAQAPTQAPQGQSQQTPADRIASPAARTQSDQQVTLTGCMTRQGDSDFVLASAKPSGASVNSSSGVPGTTSTGPVGTSGTSVGSATAGAGSTSPASPTRYRLSGERDLADYVGQPVEIVGRLDAKAAASGTSTGSATPAAGKDSPAGAISDATRGTTGDSKSDSAAASGASSSAGAASRSSIAGQTAAMPHVTITSVRALGGTCQ
jgi:hypothetical protein